MNKSKANNEERGAALTVLACVTIAAILIGAGFLAVNLLNTFKSDGSGAQYSCETRFDSTACPEPQQSEEELRAEDAKADAILKQRDETEERFYEQAEEEARREIEEENRYVEEQLEAEGY